MTFFLFLRWGTKHQNLLISIPVILSLPAIKITKFMIFKKHIKDS